MKRISQIAVCLILFVTVSCFSNTHPTQKPASVNNEEARITKDSPNSNTIDVIAFEASIKAFGDFDVITLPENRYFLICYCTGKGLIINNLTLLDDSGKHLFDYRKVYNEEYHENIGQDFYANNEKLYVSIRKRKSEEDKSYVKAIDIISGTFDDISKDSMPSDAKILVWSQSLGDRNEKYCDVKMPESDLSLKTGIKPHEKVNDEQFGSDSKLILKKYADFNI